MNALRNCTRIVLGSQRLICNNYIAQRYIKRWVRPTLIELTRRKKKHADIQPPVIRSNFLEWNRSAELYAFNSRLSEKFQTNLLEQALTHKSYISEQIAKQKELGIENPQLDIPDNEELVIEGKTILPVIIVNYLGHALPFVPHEGIIAFRNYLLSTSNLAYVCSGIGAKDLILCSTHPVPEEILADTFYALVSALTRSVNVTHASIFIRDILISTLAEKDLTEIWCPEEPFKILNNILLKENREPAEPRLVAEAGKNTLLAVYQIALYSKKQFLGIGVGNTVEEAQKMAALNALLRMFRLMDCSQSIKCNLKVSDTLEESISNMPLHEWRISNVKV